ncbi:MAG TPA: regulatory protein RecX [Bryobacteraceae bacterium]|nr:regulatory protein RecX [Bryobacteraceae bacterium]
MRRQINRSNSPKKLAAAELLEYALRSLSARAQSAGELRQKLDRRAEQPGDVAGVLARLKESGFLDDRKYAEAIAASRLENQGLGKARVLNDLRRKRVAPTIAASAVEKTYGETDELALIEAFLRRKYRSVDFTEFLAEPKNLASAYRRLRTAGFGSANSVRVLKRFAREPEVLDGLADEEG